MNDFRLLRILYGFLRAGFSIGTAYTLASSHAGVDRKRFAQAYCGALTSRLKRRIRKREQIYSATDFTTRNR